MTMLVRVALIATVACFALLPTRVDAQAHKTSASQEWEKIVEGAKKEGKVAVSIPASAEMRKQLEETFRKRFGIEIEVFPARGSAAVRRMDDEFKAGVRHFDVHIGGSSSVVSGMLDG